jgi:hypothetical protein
MIEIKHVILNSNYSSIVFKYFKIRSGRFPDRLILDHLGFWVIRVRVGSGFRSSDLRSSWVSGCLEFGSGWVSNHLISGHLGFRVIWVRVRSGFGHSNLGLSWVSGRLDPDWVEFGSVWLFEKIRSGRAGFSSRVRFYHLYLWTCEILEIKVIMDMRFIFIKSNNTSKVIWEW